MRITPKIILNSKEISIAIGCKFHPTPKTRVATN